MEKPFTKTVVFWLILLMLTSLGACLIYQYKNITELTLTLQTLREENASTSKALHVVSSTSEAHFSTYEKKFVELSDLLYAQQTAFEELSSDVRSFDKQVNRLSGSVETLEKLTTTDPELLQKYSRVYFLNEHYKPADLSVLDENYDLVDGKQVSIHSQVLPYLEDLLEHTHEDGMQLMVLSGFRSFEDQTILKETYTVRYGLGANQFSADQGYSEHQLGTAVDFTTQSIGQNLEQFSNSEAFIWLTENAYKYGFVMSYPENNEYYVYEPWHWRFVGEDLARNLHKKNKYFYDLEQREIDEYITTLFD